MRKYLCALLALALLFSCALAEEGEFRAGTGAVELGDSLFFAVDEGATWALVRVADGKTMLAARAGGIGPVLTQNGILYYLEETDGAWSLMRRGEDSVPETVYAFGAGTEVSALSAVGGDLFVLVDGQLHVVYPDQALCLRLASAKMSEYAVNGEYAYFISASDIVSYVLGAATADAGCLYRLNLSTGNTSLIMKAGIKDLMYRAGKLYFHNLSDAYLQGDSALAGKLYSFDLSTETLERALSDYDWAYFVTGAGILVYREDGVFLVDADGNEKNVCQTGTRDNVYFTEGAVLLYDPDAMTFAAYAIPE